LNNKNQVVKTIKLKEFFSVFLSTILFLPVVILFTIQYYKKNPVASIAAGSSFLLAGIFQTVATLISLSRWAYIIPESAKGEPNAMKLYETFQSLYLSIDLPGAILFYIAAVIYSIIFWYKSRVSALLLITSTILLLLGGFLGSISPSFSLILSGGSIIIYGIAYITIGDLTHRLFNENV
jgi:hypothetical protein